MLVNRSRRLSSAVVLEEAIPWVLFIAGIIICAHRGAFVLAVATITLLWVVLASGLNVIMGHGGLVNFGIGAYYGIGAYTVANLSAKHHLSIWVCILAAVVLPGVVAAVLGPVILVRTRGFQFAIATLAIGIVFDDFFNNWTSITGGAIGLAGIQRPHAISSTTHTYYFIAAWAVVVIALCQYIRSHKLGKVLRALRDDQYLARSLGFRPLRYRLAGFVVSACIAGLAGALYAYYIQYVGPSAFGLSGASFEAFAIVAFGGVATTWGPVVGAIVLTAAAEFINVTPEIKLVFYGVALLLVVLAVPEGIVPGAGRLARRALEIFGARRWVAALPAPPAEGTSLRGPTSPDAGGYPEVDAPVTK
jgi:branched-chain amino acid transport system permease protein